MGSLGRAGSLADKDGHAVVLHGVDESGTENFCTTWGPPAVVVSPPNGPSPLTQDGLSAMKSWGVNAVRIPLNEDCWLGINGVATSVGGANYQAPILAAINLITQTNDMYVILDLHFSAPGTTLPASEGEMPDQDHTLTFWQQVASAYKGNGAVIFDLFNEPHMSSGTLTQQFTCLLNGGADPSCAAVGISFTVEGMQDLVTAVRNEGASNLIMVSSPGYSSQLSLWPSFVPTDTLDPPNLAASWHVYDDQGGCTTDEASSATTLCSTSSLGAEAVMNAGYPIVLGETGYYSCSGTTGSTWWPFFLSWADAQGLGYFGWSWSSSNNPQLLASITPKGTSTTSFTYAPSAEGTIYQTYLGCIATKTVTPATSCTFLPSTGCE